MVGDGETLLPKEVIELIIVLIKNGHYVSVITNGTVTDRIHELVERLASINKETNVNFHLSLHYAELKKRNMLQTFIDNVAYLKTRGISYHIKTILGEEFDEKLANELKDISFKEFGAYPQVGIARKDNSDNTFSIYTKLTRDEYISMGKSFGSELFELDCKEFNKKRNAFCYAGDWSFMLNFSTGKCWECLSNNLNSFDFFENPSSKLQLKAVGTKCNRAYCQCVNFQAWGVMPDHEEFSNLDIYDRSEGNWVKEPFRKILNTKLRETNDLYDEKKKKALLRWQERRLRQIKGNLFKRVFRHFYTIILKH